MKLRKLFIIGATIMSLIAQKATAQWTSEASVNTPTTTVYPAYSDRPTIVASTQDGSYFIRWVQNDPVGRYGYAQYVQKMDRKGNRLWGASGVRIDTLVGITRFKDNMIVDNQGNLIVGTQNTRFAAYQQFPVVYKIDGSTGKTIWTANLDRIDSLNDYQGLFPCLAVTKSNDIIVSWGQTFLIGQGTRDGVYMHKISGADGSFMWPSRIAIQDNISMMGIFAQPVVLSDNSFMITWEHRPAGSSGSTPFNIAAQKYKLSDGSPMWSNQTEISPSNLIAPGGQCKFYDDKKGGILISYVKTGLSGAELYAQRVDTATGQNKWGTEAKLVARNTIGASANDAGTAYDTTTNKLWFAVMADEPNGGIHGDRFYLQGLDLNGKLLYGDSSTGVEFLPLSDGTPQTSRLTIGMRNTGDGLMVLYAEGVLPARTFVKAVKVDYTGKRSWSPLGDSIIMVSSYRGISSGNISDYIPADSQLVIAMTATDAAQLAQNVKNSKATGGSLGNGTIRQTTQFDTTTLYLTYGDAVPNLGGTSNTGIPPSYMVDNYDVAVVNADGTIELISAGTFNAYAYFPGTDVYVSKTSLPKRIVVRKKPMTIIAENKSTAYGHDIPTLTMTFHDFINGDDVMSFSKLPTIVSPAVTKSPIGIYPITLQGGVSTKYEPVLVNGTLTIYPSGGTENDKLEAYCSSPGTLQVNIYSTTQQNGVLQLIDMAGKILWSQQVQVPASITNTQIPVYTVAPGIYVVRYVGGSSILNQKVKIK